MRPARDNKPDTISVVLLIFAGVLTYALSGGIRANFGIIIQPLTISSGIDYASVSFVLGISQLMYGATQPLWGMLAMKSSAPLVLLCGIPLMAAGLIITAFTKSAVILTAALGIMVGSGAGALCFGMVMSAISPILGPKRAAAASGILNAGSGIGGAALSPAIQMVSAASGIKTALVLLAVPFFLLIPVILWIWKQAASVRAGQKDLPASKSGDAGSLKLLQTAFRTADYRRLMAGFFTCGFHMIIVQTHMVSYFTSLGISAAQAAFVYTAYGIFTMIGSVASGLMCSRFHLKQVLGSLYGVRAAAVVLFVFIAPRSLVTMLVFALIMGLSGDATVTPTSEIVSRRFGAGAMGFLFGITFVCHQVGAFLSSWLGGIFIEKLGSYRSIWSLDIALCLFASLVSFRIHVMEGE